MGKGDKKAKLELNSLIVTFVKIAIDMHPDVIFMENVENLLHDEQKIQTRKQLVEALDVLLGAGCVPHTPRDSSNVSSLVQVLRRV